VDRVSGRVIGQVMVWSIGVVDRVSGRAIGQVMVGYGVSERQPAVVEWLCSRVVSVLDSGAEGPGSNRSRDAVG